MRLIKTLCINLFISLFGIDFCESEAVGRRINIAEEGSPGSVNQLTPPNGQRMPLSMKSMYASILRLEILRR